MSHEVRHEDVPARCGTYQRVAYNHFVRCQGCEYSLSGLTEPRCPECGRGFDPNDWQTFHFDPQWSSPNGRRRVYTVYVFTLGPMVALALFNLTDTIWPAAVVVLLIVAFAFTLLTSRP